MQLSTHVRPSCGRVLSARLVLGTYRRYAHNVSVPGSRRALLPGRVMNVPLDHDSPRSYIETKKGERRSVSLPKGVSCTHRRTGPLRREDHIGNFSDAFVPRVLADLHDNLRGVVVLEGAPVSHDRRPRFADDDSACWDRDGRGDHVYTCVEVQDVAAPVL